MGTAQGAALMAGEKMAVVNCSAINQGEKAIKKIGRIITLSLLGGFGAGISGLLVFASLILIKEKMAKSLLGPILIQIFCFVPLGTLVGLSISYCNTKLHHQRKKLLIGSSIGGILYGALNFFSIEGSLIGLPLFCMFLAGSIEKALGSMKKAATVLLSSLAVVLSLFILMRISNQGFMFVLAILDPLRTISSVGPHSILWLILTFYILNVSMLIPLWSDINKKT